MTVARCPVAVRQLSHRPPVRPGRRRGGQTRRHRPGPCPSRGRPPRLANCGSARRTRPRPWCLEWPTRPAWAALGPEPTRRGWPWRLRCRRAASRTRATALGSPARSAKPRVGQPDRSEWLASAIGIVQTRQRLLGRRRCEVGHGESVGTERCARTTALTAVAPADRHHVGPNTGRVREGNSAGTSSRDLAAGGPFRGTIS